MIDDLKYMKYIVSISFDIKKINSPIFTEVISVVLKFYIDL